MSRFLRPMQGAINIQMFGERIPVAFRTHGNTPLLIGSMIVFGAATCFIFLLHARLGVADVDGYAYLIGARSLHEGNGYRGLTGEAFNHWPPGYSLLLSVFPE